MLQISSITASRNFIKFIILIWQHKTIIFAFIALIWKGDKLNVLAGYNVIAFLVYRPSLMVLAVLQATARVDFGYKYITRDMIYDKSIYYQNPKIFILLHNIPKPKALEIPLHFMMHSCTYIEHVRLFYVLTRSILRENKRDNASNLLDLLSMCRIL